MSDAQVKVDVDVFTVPVTLKWSKKKYEFDISLTSASTTSTGPYTGRSLKERVYQLTGVPIERQKLIGNGVPWKGILKDEFDFSVLHLEGQGKNSLVSPPSPLRITLLGSAEVLSGPPTPQPTTTTTTTRCFLEDLTPEERRMVDRSVLEATLPAVISYIPSLQVLPYHRFDDVMRQSDEMYSYNRLVHGLPQYQIEHLLLEQQQQQKPQTDETPAATRNESLPSPHSAVIPSSDDNINANATTQLSLLMMEEDGDDGNTETATTDRRHPYGSMVHPVGRVAMTLGLELQRAYVNDLTVLDEIDGTLVCGLEDGHIQLWKHGQRTHDVLHLPHSAHSTNDGGVLSVLAIQRNTTTTTSSGDVTNTIPSHIAFATAGRGTVRLWTEDADEILAVPSPFPTAASPTSLVQIRSTTTTTTTSSNNGLLCLAVRYHIVRPPSQRPRLVPQDDVGRQRLAYIEAQEMAIDETLERLGRTVQVWYHDKSSNNNTDSSSSSAVVGYVELLSPESPVTCLASWTDPLSGNGILAAGDATGGIHIWKMVLTSSVPAFPNFVPITSYQLTGPTGLGIVSMTYLTDGTDRLIISTGNNANAPTPTPQFTSTNIINIVVTPTQAVHIVNVSNVTAPYLEVSLNGHRDIVQYMLPLPNGDLVTAGGKNDATMQVWSNTQLRKAVPQSKTRNESDGEVVVLTHAATPCLCKDVGYVFGLALLKDFKPGSNHFAIAAARYNVVKIIV